MYVSTSKSVDGLLGITNQVERASLARFCLLHVDIAKDLILNGISVLKLVDESHRPRSSNYRRQGLSLARFLQSGGKVFEESVKRLCPPAPVFFAHTLTHNSTQLGSQMILMLPRRNLNARVCIVESLEKGEQGVIDRESVPLDRSVDLALGETLRFGVSNAWVAAIKVGAVFDVIPLHRVRPKFVSVQ